MREIRALKTGGDFKGDVVLFFSFFMKKKKFASI